MSKRQKRFTDSYVAAHLATHLFDRRLRGTTGEGYISIEEGMECEAEYANEMAQVAWEAHARILRGGHLADDGEGS